MNLFSKNEDITKSAPVVGAKILKIFRDKKINKISIFDIAKELKKNNTIGVRAMYYGLIFLYSVDMIYFEEPYVINNNADY
ncbi:hypothetical protein Rahaq_1182 [Rahnella aceris]|uniref:Uncharacterized protein n=1 Tax=Rahnella sp. (strain Y9602) TaxID=2703885 RepID=A0A0H3F9R6_RAHSY|nr:hypothetical protein [Rahnella aceris]ADW72805.1 hypothetical protein Rahaq_1182 [Rahnella aceris]